jgi:hypothetical protein
MLEAGGDKAFRLGRDEIALCARPMGRAEARAGDRADSPSRRVLDGDLSVGRTCRCTSLPPARSSPPESGPRPFTAIVRASMPGLLACRSTDSPRPYWKPRHPCNAHPPSGWAISRRACRPDRLAVDGCSLPSSACRSRARRLPMRAWSRRRAREIPDPRCAGGSATRCGQPGHGGRPRAVYDRVPRGGTRPLDRQGAEGVYAIGPRPGRGEGARHRVRWRTAPRARDAVALDVWRGSTGCRPPRAGSSRGICRRSCTASVVSRSVDRGGRLWRTDNGLQDLTDFIKALEAQGNSCASRAGVAGPESPRSRPRGQGTARAPLRERLRLVDAGGDQLFASRRVLTLWNPPTTSGTRGLSSSWIRSPRRPDGKVEGDPEVHGARLRLPKTVRSAPCQEIVETGAVDLTRLPVLQC